MTYVPSNGKAPDDVAAEAAWEQIMRLASANALIVQAYSGVAVVAVPSEQRKQGVREQVLRMGDFELEASPEAQETA